MSNVIGLIGDIDGKFYALSANGNKREIQSGDELYAGESVVGSESNVESDAVVVTLTSDDSSIVIVGNSTESFSNLATPKIQVARVEDSKVEAIASILGETENMDEIDTAAGEGGSGPESTEGGEALFAKRNDASVDVEAKASTNANIQTINEDASGREDDDEDHELARLTTLNNGTVIDADGTITVTDRDGTITVTSPDGTVTVTDPDGTTTVTDPDGTVTITNPDGTTTVTDPDGTTTVTDPDGTVTITNPDGSTDVTDPDGTNTVTSPDGTTTVTTPDGTVTVTDPDGTTTVTDPDGTVTITNPDGSTDVTDPDGTNTVTNPDGTTTVTTPDGTITVTSPDGTTTVTDPDGTVTVTDPDGTTTVTDPDGTVTITNPDGSTDVTDPDGTNTVTSADGTTTVTTPDGTVTVTDPDGTTTVTDPDGTVTITNPDGSTDVTDPDGTNTVTSADGVITITDPNGVVTVIEPITAISDSNTGTGDTPNLTNDNTPTISGVTKPNSEVVITDADGNVLGTTTSDADGNYSVELSELPDGENVLTITVIDEDGKVYTDTITINVDTGINSDTNDAITAEIDSATSTGDITNLTNDNTPTITGNTEPNSLVEIYDGDTLIGSGMSDENGDYSITISDENALSDGEHELTIKVTDEAGNTLTDTIIINVDTTIDSGDGEAPITAGLSDDTNSGSIDDNITNNTTPTIVGNTEANVDVVITTVDGEVVGTGTSDVNGDYTITLSELPDGDNALSVTATDEAGNNETLVISVVVDTELSATDATIDLLPVSDGFINSTEVTQTLNINGTSTATAGSVVTLTLNGGQFPTENQILVKADGTFSVDIDASGMADFADGSYTLTATVIADAAGNTVSDSETVVLDTSSSDNNDSGNTDSGADATISLSQISDNFINEAEAIAGGIAISGTSTAVAGSIVNINVAGQLFGTTEVLANGTFSLDIEAGVLTNTTAFPDGTYSVTATVISDEAGNTVTSTQDVILDRELSDSDNDNDGNLVTIDSIVGDTGANDFITSDTTLIVQGTFDNEEDNHLIVTVDGEQRNIIIDGNNWSVNLEDVSLSEGTHEVIATIADSAGNTASATQTITIDTTPADANAIVLDDISGGYLNASEDSQDLVISGSVGSASVDGKTVTVTFNGVEYYTVVENGRFSVTVPASVVADLVDGDTYTATASTDTSNATVTSTKDITVDKTFEVVGNNGNHVTFDGISDDTGLAGDFITTDNSIVMRGTFDNTNSNTLTITVNGTLFTPTIDGNNWTLDYSNTPYPDGTYEVVATLTDLAGNHVTKTQNVVIDTSATNTGDATIILDEISGNYINANEAANETIFITGSTTNAGGESVTIKVNGNYFTSTTVQSDGTFSIEIPAGTFSLYTDGTYTVSAEVVADTAGNIVSDSEEVILDRNSDDTGSGDGTGTGGADASITLNEISDDYINLAESGLPVVVSGTTTAVASTAIVVNFNGVDYSTVALSDGTFSVNVDASSVIDGTTLNVTASVVADAAENLAFANEDVTIDLSAGIIQGSITEVFESALETGSNPSESGRTLNGNLLEGSSQTEGSTLSSISINGVEGNVWSENENILELNTPRGVIYVATTDTVVSGIAYSMGDYIYTLDSAGSDAMESIVYTMSDEAGNTSSATLNINIVDDSPVVSEVSVDKYINADTDHTNVTNLVLTIDVSGSMAWDADGRDSSSWWFNEDTVRLDLAKDALSSLINKYSEQGDVNVKIVAFSSDGYDTNKESQWLDEASAITYINSLTAAGGTDYDNAITRVEDIDSSLYPEADDSFFYFVSDGEPTHGTLDTDAEIASWNSYVDANFDKAFAVGVGTSSESLTNIGTTETIVISSATDLDTALLSTISSVTGNLISYDINGSVINLGADGGKIDSVEIDSITYGYDEYNNQSITTQLGGEFKIDFDDGSYSYSVGIDNPNNTDSEIVTVNATSSDGESATGTLTLHLQENDDQSYLYKENVSVDAADGYDTLVMNDSIDIGEFNMNITNVNAIDMGKGESNGKDLGLTLEDILGITEADHTLHISGDEFDHIDLGDDSNWQKVTSDESGYDKYTHTVDPTVTLQIEETITIDHI